MDHNQILARDFDPPQRIAEVLTLTEAARQLILVDWNKTEVEFEQRLLHEWFEARVELSPHARALTFGGGHLTYRELNCRANQLAHFLRRMGVGPDVLVGIYLERSLEMVLGLLGILKAGGAYVPIDPHYPSERVAFMLEDANPPLLLLQGRFKSSVQRYHGRILCLDDDWDQIAGEETSNPPRQAAPDNLAYMIYTSGSTRAPKGAMNTHRGICNRLLWGQSHFLLTPSDAVLQKTPFSFDVSVWEFFWPLLAGARLVVAKPEGHRDPEYLANLIVGEEITVCHFVPAMLAVFLAHPAAAKCRSLRHVICSGEALPFRLQEQFFQLLPAQLHNLYGPTETGVEVTYWRCRPDSGRNIVPIGRPVANTRLHFGYGFTAVPIGMSGELYIGGVQVGRGYFNRPELTAEKFTPDPFSGDPKARIYRTGDICRWLEDGNIEYLGRLDFQVKIRGHRIELREVEAALSRHPDVRNVAVVVKNNGENGQYLVAFVDPSSSGSPSPEQLRDFLRQKLPLYMLPSRFLVLKQLPVLQNGKIDRAALNHWTMPGANEAIVVPFDGIERRLAEIWRALLGIHSIGTNDDFFDLGGESLLAAKLLAQIEREFSVRLSLSSVFQAPTIDALARAIGTRRQPGLRLVQYDKSAPASSSLVPIQPAGSKPPIFCISGVGGGVFVFQILARHLGVDQPIYGLQPAESDANAPMTVPDIARHYIREMRAVQPHGPYFLAGFSFGGLVAYEMACQLRAAGQQIGLLAVLDTDLRDAFRAVPFSTRLHNRWSVYGLHWRRFLGTNNRTSYLMEILRGWAAKRIYRVCLTLGRRMSGRAASFGTILDIQTFAGSNYSPGIYDGRVLLFRCCVRPAGEESGRDLGWSEVARGGLEVHEIPGDHHSMWVEPNIRAVAARLKTCLHQARDGNTRLALHSCLR